MITIRKLFMRFGCHIRDFGDWVYDKALGYEDFISPSYCKHCEKWSFEEKE